MFVILSPRPRQSRRLGHAGAVNPAESNDVIRLAWQPEAADYVEAFSARNRQRHVGWFIAAMSVLGVALAVLAIGAGQPGAAALGVVAAVGFPVGTPLVVKASTNALWRRNAALRQPVQVVIDARGVGGDAPVVTMNPGAMHVATGSVQYQWTDLQKVLEASRVFVVQLADRRNKVFFLLAKRGLSDPAQEANLRRLLTAVS
jgi:hypothetical protein